MCVSLTVSPASAQPPDTSVVAPSGHEVGGHLLGPFDELGPGVQRGLRIGRMPCRGCGGPAHEVGAVALVAQEADGGRDERVEDAARPARPGTTASGHPGRPTSSTR